MDSSIMVSVFIAMIVIIPGLWALINQIKKDGVEARLDMFRTIQNVEINRLQERSVFLEELPAEELFKKMYNKPVIIHCKYCRSPNVITNSDCIKCGAPIGG